MLSHELGLQTVRLYLPQEGSMREKINLKPLSAPLLPLCFLFFKDHAFCLPVLSLHHQESKPRVDVDGDGDDVEE